MKKKILIVSTVLLILGLLITSCDVLSPKTDSTPIPTPVSNPGVIAEANLVPKEQTILGFTVPGKVREVLVEEGDRVEAGEMLARLENVESLEAQVSSAELAVLQAQQALDELNENADLSHAQAQIELIQARLDLIDAEHAWDAVDTDEFQENLDDARIEMNDAKEELEEAEENMEEHQDLDEDNPIRDRYEDDLEEAQQTYDEAMWAFEELQNQYDLAKAQLEAAQASLEDAETRAENTQDGPDPDDLAMANANLDQAQAQLTAAERALADAKLTAPYAGKIVRVELVEGTQVSPGELAMILIDDSVWFLETNDLTEDEVIEVETEQKVTVRFDALPGKTFSGQVESISDYFMEQYGDITYIVRIRLEDFDKHLRWGMTAEVNFQD